MVVFSQFAFRCPRHRGRPRLRRLRRRRRRAPRVRRALVQRRQVRGDVFLLLLFVLHFLVRPREQVKVSARTGFGFGSDRKFLWPCPDRKKKPGVGGTVGDNSRVPEKKPATTGQDSTTLPQRWEIFIRDHPRFDPSTRIRKCVMQRALSTLGLLFVYSPRECVVLGRQKRCLSKRSGNRSIKVLLLPWEDLCGDGREDLPIFPS